jgi:signal transduction histidine kinase/DNA-binding response OmpR family regulator
VKGTNSDGVWSNQETRLYITVLPPFWKSNIAFFLYAGIIFGMLLLGSRLVAARERLRYRIETERLSAQRLHELDEMKIKFFTNVSHELRTPLTLIITPLEKIIKDTAPVEKRQLNVVYKNAKRLLNLVNQLLDFKRVDGDDLKMNSSEGDIVKFIKDLVSSFSDLSEKKNIQLSFNANVGSLETLFDPDKLEKIVFNLLSNAFKFTPDHGYVSVDVHVLREAESKTLQLTVRDTGIGIPEDKYERIFDRFYQNEVPKNMVNQGSGIGLSIAQEFVKLHGGTITVSSVVGEGSTFTVTLPIADISDTLFNLDTPDNEAAPDDPTKTTVLLVDDSDDFRSYLRDSLKNQYAILEAPNGKVGLKLAFNHLPELIICDVMMPEMDGIELCRRIREDSRTSHIAVILLTARTAAEQKVEGFKAGANDYITKPFSFEVLESRIENLVKMRALSHEQFQNHLDIKVSDIQVASVDEKLVKDAVKVVEDNLTNEDFSVEAMSKMLGMSRVHLYKKLFSLTGKTPIEFIRFIRIKRAAQLLEKSGLSVSEVAYKVGFSNPKYLAKYFRDVYGMLPSEFVSSVKKTS